MTENVIVSLASFANWQFHSWRKIQKILYISKIQSCGYYRRIRLFGFSTSLLIAQGPAAAKGLLIRAAILTFQISTIIFFVHYSTKFGTESCPISNAIRRSVYQLLRRPNKAFKKWSFLVTASTNSQVSPTLFAFIITAHFRGFIDD